MHRSIIGVPSFFFFLFFFLLATSRQDTASERENKSRYLICRARCDSSGPPCFHVCAQLVFSSPFCLCVSLPLLGCSATFFGHEPNRKVLGVAQFQGSNANFSSSFFIPGPTTSTSIVKRQLGSDDTKRSLSLCLSLETLRKEQKGSPWTRQARMQGLAHRRSHSPRGTAHWGQPTFMYVHPHHACMLARIIH